MTSVHRGSNRTAGREQGSISVFAAVFALAALLLLGLVVDGGGRLRAFSDADAIAAEAARSAVEAIDTRGTTLTLDRTAAIAAVHAYLHGGGYSGTVAVTGPRTVTVTVTVQRRYVVSLPGTGSTYTATGHATAVLGVGVTTGDQ